MSDYEFDGYNEMRYTPVPDEFFDWQMQDLTGGEMKVIMYIFRRTFGFKKHQDRIALSQFADGIEKRSGERLDRGCGLSKGGVQGALTKLLERGYVDCQSYCGRCGRMIERYEMETKIRHRDEESYTVSVVPELCPGCGKSLYGCEERWFSLVMERGTIHKQGDGMPQHTPRYAPAYPPVCPSIPQDTVPRDSIKKIPADAEKTPEEELSAFFGGRRENPKPIEHCHWSERHRDEPWRGWSNGHFTERDGVSAATQERVGALLEQHTGERPRSDGQWLGWSNTVIEIYKASGGDWPAIESGIATAAGYDSGYVPHIASRKGEVNGWATAAARAKAEPPTPPDPFQAECARKRREMLADPQYQASRQQANA